jgi:hypothetical protein
MVTLGPTAKIKASANTERARPAHRRGLSLVVRWKSISAKVQISAIPVFAAPSANPVTGRNDEPEEIGDGQAREGLHDVKEEIPRLPRSIRQVVIDGRDEEVSEDPEEVKIPEHTIKGQVPIRGQVELGHVRREIPRERKEQRPGRAHQEQSLQRPSEGETAGLHSARGRFLLGHRLRSGRQCDRAGA